MPFQSQIRPAIPNTVTAMAEAGHGGHYYGQTAGDLQSAFEEEFALLEALYAHDITLAFWRADTRKPLHAHNRA